MHTLYICGTEYQLLVTLLKTYQKKAIKIMITFSMDGERREKLINRYGYNIYYVNEYSFGIDWRRGQFNFLKDNVYHYFTEVEKIYIYMDNRLIGDYFRRKNISYHLIEDGLNYYQYQFEYHIGNVYRSKIMKFLYKYLCHPTLGYGFSDLCKSIEVNSLEKLPMDDRKNKYIEVSRKKLFSDISIELKNALMDVYRLEPLSIKSNSVLIITQPLAYDRWYKTKTDYFQTEKEQFEYYKEIVDRYSGLDYSVYLKIHPRDTVDYSSLSVNILPKNIPMELLDMVSDNSFQFGITHSSTALDFLTCVKEKITLFNLKEIE